MPLLFEYRKNSPPGAAEKTRLTISGKYTGEIPLATQGERRQIAAECLVKCGTQSGQKKNPGDCSPES